MRTHICSTSRRITTLVPVEEVDYFKAEDKYVTVYYKDSSVLIEESLKSLHADLGEDFIRVHRNALVRKTAISKMRKTPTGNAQIKVNDTWVDASRRYAPDVRRYMRDLGQ